ncbi:MAG: hypothetical protein AAF639_05290 [Chloroflexota bacterium]
MQDVMIQMPEPLYARLANAAHATRQPLQDILLHALKVGSPPSWEEAPAMFQADLAALDRLDDDSLWRIARSSRIGEDRTRYDELLDKNANGSLTERERTELNDLRNDADLFMLRKAYAVDLLRWRGHVIPPANQLIPLQ